MLASWPVAAPLVAALPQPKQGHGKRRFVQVEASLPVPLAYQVALHSLRSRCAKYAWRSPLPVALRPRLGLRLATVQLASSASLGVWSTWAKGPLLVQLRLLVVPYRQRPLLWGLGGEPESLAELPHCRRPARAATAAPR